MGSLHVLSQHSAPVLCLVSTAHAVFFVNVSLNPRNKVYDMSSPNYKLRTGNPARRCRLCSNFLKIIKKSKIKYGVIQAVKLDNESENESFSASAIAIVMQLVKYD